MASKRGRPPKGEFTGKSAVFNTRITPELREALKLEAQRNGRSLSQEIERRLSDSIRAPKMWELEFGLPRNKALALVVAKLAQGIERQTDLSWQEDRFTFEALKVSINYLLAKLAPSVPLTVPKAMEEHAATVDEINPGSGAEYLKPEGPGVANAVVFLNALSVADKPTLAAPMENYLYSFLNILTLSRKALGLEGGKK